MIGNFPPCLSFTIGPSSFGPLGEEGGWADNPQDPGGCTMRGVTLRTYADWCARNGLPEPTPDDLRAIPDSQLSVIYHGGYWRPIAGDELPRGVDLMVFDFGVNAGTGTSARLLQRVVGVAEDGDIGPITLAAVRAQRPAALIEALAVAQDAHYTGLADFAEFGAGWLARTTRRRAAALRMAA